jgi:hypothetical protein
MTYLDEATWGELSRNAAATATQMINALNYGLEYYERWQTFRNSRDNATIATALGVTEAKVADLDAAYGALKYIFDFCDNVASPTQGDRIYALRKFAG